MQDINFGIAMALANLENILSTEMQHRADLFRNQMKLITRDQDLHEAKIVFIEYFLKNLAILYL